MRVLTFEAVQDPKHPDHDPATGGATITCYLNTCAGDPVAAATKHIKAAGWVIVRKTKDKELDPDECSPDDEQYENIIQAVADGEVFIFDAWPADQKK